MQHSTAALSRAPQQAQKRWALLCPSDSSFSSNV